jgi:glycosyltransferase involved in cell wall biosynthesis
MAQPTVSIITVCYNAERYIEQTIRSVLDQSYPYIEYIIVDGASTDRTLEIIARFGDRISRVVSEKDAGLYDAMNKGLDLATGEYVLFLNADDKLHATDTLQMALSHCKQSDVLYGEALLIEEGGRPLGLRSEQTPHKTPRRLTWKSLRFGMTVSHQAFIVRRTLAVSYDLRYRICADIDWMIRCLKHCQTTCYTGLIISDFRIGGTSTQQRKAGWKERYRILRHHYGWLGNLFSHGYIVLRYLLGSRHRIGGS